MCAVNVLYVDHTSLVSGAQHALLDLLRGLPPRIVPTLMCPEGPLAQKGRALGVGVRVFPGTAGSFRLHPWHTPRTAGDIARSAFDVRRTAEAIGADVVHANSIRAGLIVGAARRLGAPPTVVHVHDALPPSGPADVVRSVLRRTADAVITISDYTTDCYAANGSRDAIHMLHNPLDLVAFDPGLISKSVARETLGLPGAAPIVGMVAQITPWKGQDVAIKALARMRERRPDVRLLLVGEAKFVGQAARYDNRSFEAWLHRLVRSQQLESRVEFWGERDDVATIIRALDVLVAPSWAEPFGRSVIEAMALETAVIATSVGGPPEFIEDGVNGLVLPPRDVEAWAIALDGLLGDAPRRETIARRGSLTASRFDLGGYVDRVVTVYDMVLA
jgi:glycosyltransferase involved in cell wall biosynthesis